MIHYRVSSGLTHKHYTRLERLVKDKRSSLLRKVVNYGRKSFITLGLQWRRNTVCGLTNNIRLGLKVQKQDLIRCCDLVVRFEVNISPFYLEICKRFQIIMEQHVLYTILSKSKWWYSNNCLHFMKRAFPMQWKSTIEMKGITRCKLTIISESAVCKKFLGQIWCPTQPVYRFLIVIQ